MAPAECIIDLEWAKTLIGLCMSEPKSWLKGLRGNKLHQGKIIVFLDNTNKRIVLLDNVNNPTHYPLNWKVVC